MIGRTLGRLILIPIAALLAALSAIAVLVSLGLERFTHATYGQQLSPENLITLFDWLMAGLQWASAATVLPAVAVIIAGEVAGIRSWLYYVIGGGIALAIIPLLTVFDQGVAAAVPLAAVWQVLATAGFAGGLVYWLVAGRTA